VQGRQEVEDNLRVILIGGSSHAGKSTVAQILASKLGWISISTDSLARHPGRPWRTKQRNVPPHVAEHYLTLSTDELFTDVLHHYRRVWVAIEAMITQRAAGPSADHLILEGSAIWPEFAAALGLENVMGIWLTASNDLFQKRIYFSSQFEKASAQEKVLIQKFLERTILYNQKMLAAIHELGLQSLEVEEDIPPGRLSDMCLELVNYPSV